VKVFGFLAMVTLWITMYIGSAASLQADSGPGQSLRVAVIGSPVVRNGGTLPTTGVAGELGDFIFTNLAPASVNAASLANFDTVVLNVASTQMACNTGTLSAGAKADLVAFVSNGGKLIIYDSECATQNYSWLPYPFTTSNPGQRAGRGTLTIVEDNTLSSSDSANVHYIDAANLGSRTDAVGDMNVMTTYDPNWCLDMTGTNTLGASGPVHTYARLGTPGQMGLIIYNGLDMDQIGSEPTPPKPNGLRKIWLQELQQPFSPDNLPCGRTVVGISLSPTAAQNLVGDSHTITATVTDLLGAPQSGVLVNFMVTAGPNAGQVSDPGTGECSANVACTSDANGMVSWTYASGGSTGTDTIVACFVNQSGIRVCSQQATKVWLPVADLAISKTGSPNPVIAGGLLTYTLSVSNHGPSAGPNVFITDTIPASTTFVLLTSPSGWSCNTPPVGGAGNVSCHVSSFASGPPVLFSVTIQVDAGTPGGATVVNTASVSSDAADLNLANNTATVVTRVAAPPPTAVTLSSFEEAGGPRGWHYALVVGTLAAALCGAGWRYRKTRG